MVPTPPSPDSLRSIQAPPARADRPQPTVGGRIARVMHMVLDQVEHGAHSTIPRQLSIHSGSARAAERHITDPAVHVFRKIGQATTQVRATPFPAAPLILPPS